jgi:hypothetical protein
MYPAVPVPESLTTRPVIDITLKPGWRLDAGKRWFISASGERCVTGDGLPKGSRTVPKVPALAKTPVANLSPPEKDLLRYVQVVLPQGERPEHYLSVITGWPCVAEVSLPPQVSLPTPAPSRSRSKRAS